MEFQIGTTPDRLGTLKQGHRAQKLFARMNGVGSGLSAFAAINGQLVAVPETDPATDPDPMHPGRGPRAEGLPPLARFNGDGTLNTDTTQPGQTTNLKGEGVPEDLPIFLQITVKQHPEGVGTSFLVGPLMKQFDTDVAKGGIFRALDNFYTNATGAFNRVASPGGGGTIHDAVFPLNADAIVEGIVQNIPGVVAAVTAGIPEAQA
jgi:hypothetical protein